MANPGGRSLEQKIGDFGYSDQIKYAADNNQLTERCNLNPKNAQPILINNERIMTTEYEENDQLQILSNRYQLPRR